VAEAKGQVGVLQASDLEAASLADRAYHAIREMIVSLELRPGAVIDERGLMERLGIGRTPTREALRRLAQERLVEVYPRRGMFVTSVEIRDLASLAEVRSVLESHVARLAAERATDEDIAHMREICVRMEAEADVEAASLHDVEFHRAIARGTHNELHLLLLDSIGDALIEIRRENLIAGSGPDAIASHREILDRIAARDPDGAMRAMRAHLENVEAHWRRRTEAVRADSEG